MEVVIAQWDLGFRPIDEELINYLLKFVCGPFIQNDHIRQVDLYGNKKPCDIFYDLCSEGEMMDMNYVFTQLKRKSASGWWWYTEGFG